SSTSSRSKFFRKFHLVERYHEEHAPAWWRRAHSPLRRRKFPKAFHRNYIDSQQITRYHKHVLKPKPQIKVLVLISETLLFTAKYAIPSLSYIGKPRNVPGTRWRLES